MFILGILSLATLATEAWAHASLISSMPASGAVLEQSPGSVVLSFNEPSGLLAVRLITSDGASYDLRDFSASGAIISIELPEVLPEGTSVLSWRAASEDGHPIAGTVLFSIGTAGGTAANIVAEDPLVSPLLWLARAVMFVGVFLGAGAGGFRILDVALPRSAGLAATWLMAFGFAAGGWSFLLHGLTLLGLPLTAVLRPEPWVAGTFSTYGATVIVLFSALLLGYIAVNAPPRRTAAGAGALALLAIGLAATLSGHASTAEPQWLMKMAVFIHVVCIAWWVGSLFPLGLVLGEGRSRAAPPLVRFSRWIPFAIVPLVASGATLAVVQLGWPGAAWLSPYGYVLAGKLVLLVILFAAACYNRWVLTAPAVRGEARAMQRMRRTILTEIILVLAILALVAGWRFTPPPRALADATDPVLTATSVELIDGAITATVLLDSPMVGAVSGTLSLASTDGKLMIPRSVAVSFALPDAGIEEIDAELVPDGEGAWEIQGVVLPVPGEWQVEVEVRVSDFDLARMRGELVVVP